MTDQDKLDGATRRNLRWGSHRALNISLLKTFPITGVLELGAGFNSTGLFFKRCGLVTSIESDRGWITKMIDDGIEETNTHKLVHHQVPNQINRSVQYGDIDNDIHTEAVNLYRNNIHPFMNYMFVDCYAGFRFDALKLHNRFDVIAYHDAQEEHYNYDKFEPHPLYDHYIDKTFLAWTGLLVHKKFAMYMDILLDNLDVESANYAQQFNTNYEVKLERVNDKT
jgi:hypothetical protein